MKRIAIFCDGTWNRHDAVYPTNVVRLAQAVKLTAADGIKQQVFYVLGVGAGRGHRGDDDPDHHHHGPPYFLRCFDRRDGCEDFLSL